MYCSMLTTKHDAEVGLGVGVTAVAEGEGIGVPVTVAVGTGVGGGATIFLPAAATQLPAVGKVTGVHVAPLSFEV